MQKVFPELVVEDKEGYLSVDYSRFTSVLLKAIQEQQQIIQEQQKIIRQLEEENFKIKQANVQIKAEMKLLNEKVDNLINSLSNHKELVK
jgi:cell division protein FtsB